MEIKIPQVLRARGFRLYLANKQRLVDLWQNGGAAVLGHTPPNLLRELKNTASRGLYAPFPHFTEGRFIKALSKLLPGRSFRLYAAPPQELSALYETGEAKLWRPFINPDSPFAADESAPLLIPVIPGIHTWQNGLPIGLCVVAAQIGSDAAEKFLPQLPPGDTLSPVLLAVAARGVYDLLTAPERGKPHFPKITKALKTNECPWQRNGIYLTLKNAPSPSEWETLFNKFLKAGFLLPPDPTQTVILPGELSEGEETKLATAL